MSVTSEIQAATNATTMMQAAQPKATGVASKLGAQEFMNLMMKQLQYQDPLEPVSNTEFISQQAQFTQLSSTQEMNENISTNNSIMQTLTLVGKEVTIPDTSDKTGKKMITGIVEQANFTNDGATIQVNGKEYPISLVKTVRPASSAETNTGS